MLRLGLGLGLTRPGGTPPSSVTDTTPDVFTFTDIEGLTSTVYESNTITVGGINAAAAVTVSGGEYSKNGGAYTSAAGTASLGDTFRVRLTSSGSASTPTSCTLTIGGVSDTYTVTTSAPPVTGDILSVQVLGPGAIDAANNNVVDGNGWVAAVTVKDMATGGTLDASKLVLTVSGPGFNAAGATVTRVRTIRGLYHLRKPFPNANSRMEAASGSNAVEYVVLDQRIYAGETITAGVVEAGFYTVGGVPSAASEDFTTFTHASTFTYGLPQVYPVDPGWRRVGSTLSAAIAVTDTFFQESRMAAMVRLTISDGTTTITRDITSMADCYWRTRGNPTPVFQATGIDISSLADGVCWYSWKVYPFRGSAIFDSEVHGYGSTGAQFKAADNLTQHTEPKVSPFLKDAAGTYATQKLYAYVNAAAPTNSGGVVSANPATAKASPFRTIAYAAWQLQVQSGALNGRANLAGHSCRVMAGTHDGTGSQGSITPGNLVRGPTWFEVEPDPDAAAGTVIITTSVSNTERILPRRTRVSGGIILQGNGSRSGTGTVFDLAENQTAWGSGFINELWVDGAHFAAINGTTGNSGTYASYSALRQAGRMFVSNCTGNDGGGSIGTSNSNVRNAVVMACFNEFTAITGFANCSKFIGNKVNYRQQTSGGTSGLDGSVTNRCAIILANSSTKQTNAPWRLGGGFGGGAGVVQNLFEPIGNTAAKGMELSADGVPATPPQANVICAYNTVPGDAINFMYNEISDPSGSVGSAASYKRKTGVYSFNLALDFNVKSDLYDSNGQQNDWQRVGNFECRYHVEFYGNANYGGSEGNGGPTSLLGELPVAVLQSRLASTYTGTVAWTVPDGSVYGTNVGGGTYIPTSASLSVGRVPATARTGVANAQGLPFDLYGTARRTDGTGHAGAIEGLL